MCIRDRLDGTDSVIVAGDDVVDLVGITVGVHDEMCIRDRPTAAAEGVQLDHHPDPEKSRGQYLNLLELSVEEDPDDDRNMHLSLIHIW